MRKMILSLILAVLTVLSATGAFAAMAWHTGKVRTVGTDPWGGYQISFSEIDGGTTMLYFPLDSNMSNELMAMALTAISTGNTVEFYADTTCGHWCTTVTAMNSMSSSN